MPYSLAYQPRNALNAICPYFTMFPLEFPLRVLRKHVHGSPVVMDPFCGRGTTIFAARSLGLRSRGIDSSKIAVAIAQAKLCSVEIEDVLELAECYLDEHSSVGVPRSSFFRIAFDSSVLRHICAIRRGLLLARGTSDAVVMLRAAMLGCLHGPLSKSLAGQSYFCNQMPRTFSTKPEYSVRYWKSHRLAAPKVDVLAVLARKLGRIRTGDFLDAAPVTNVRIGDARLARSNPNSERDYSIVVTSPPYYGMRTYMEDQWLRLWFLGGPSRVLYGNDFQLSHGSPTAFAESLGSVWKNMARSNSSRLDMYVRFGTMASSRIAARKTFLESLESSRVHWKVVSVRCVDSAGRRQADQMGDQKPHTEEYDFHIVRK